MTEAGWTSRQIVYHELERMASIYPLTVGDNKSSEGMTRLLESLIAKMDDTYKQGRVAGLREAEDYAERCVKERQLQLLNLGDQAALDPNDRRPGWIRCKASEARRIQVWCIRQTQQAQDEKGVGDASG